MDFLIMGIIFTVVYFLGCDYSNKLEKQENNKKKGIKK